MQRVIETTSSPDLLAALESNMVAFWSCYGRAPGCRLESTPATVWFYTGIPHPLFNGVISVKWSKTDVESTFESLRQMIATRHAPALWWVGPNSAHEELGPALSARGLQPTGEAPGMAMELEALGAAPDVPADFAIEKVEAPEIQATWARTAAEGTGVSPAAVEAMARIEATLDGPEYRAQPRFLGKLAGVPVATSALVLEAGVAGIYAVATLSAARHKGIGTYMTIAALHEARRSGYRVAILQSSPMGHPLYRKMGFRDVCTYRLFLQN